MPIDAWQKGLGDSVAFLKWNPEDPCLIGIEFSKDTWDLGDILVALFEDETKRQFGLMHSVWPDRPGTDILVPMDLEQWEEYLFEILDFLQLDLEDLSWNREFSSMTVPGSWDLCRMDDNGNVFVIATFGTEGKATRIMREFEAKGHKQTYWVKRREMPVLEVGNDQ